MLRETTKVYVQTRTASETAMGLGWAGETDAMDWKFVRPAQVRLMMELLLVLEPNGVRGNQQVGPVAPALQEPPKVLPA